MAMASSAPACPAHELLAKGRESAAAILQALHGQQPPAADDMPDGGLLDLTEQILRCFDRALAALRGGTGDDAIAGARKRKLAGALAPPPHGTSSKRMRGSCEEKGTTRVEKQGTMDDGFIWRKYGQKEICDSKYPRLYFRCTYKEDHGCMAKRQVQRSDADPSLYLITYFGEHTCCRHDADELPPAPFVINFGSSSSTCGDDGQPPNVSPSWPSCVDADGCLAALSDETSSDLCNSPEKEMLAGTGDNLAEWIVQHSTPVSSPVWDPLDALLDWEFANDDALFDIGQFINFDYFC